MKTMINPDAVKTFVRETLGCQCPDSVFEQVDYQENAGIVDQNMITRRLLIGSRLLMSKRRVIVSCSKILACS